MTPDHLFWPTLIAGVIIGIALATLARIAFRLYRSHKADLQEKARFRVTINGKDWTERYL